VQGWGRGGSGLTLHLWSYLVFGQEGVFVSRKLEDFQLEAK
jgi:hypothetical protein